MASKLDGCWTSRTDENHQSDLWKIHIFVHLTTNGASCFWMHRGEGRTWANTLKGTRVRTCLSSLGLKRSRNGWKEPVSLYMDSHFTRTGWKAERMEEMLQRWNPQGVCYTLSPSARTMGAISLLIEFEMRSVKNAPSNKVGEKSTCRHICRIMPC